MNISEVIFIFAAFISGSIPFAVWIGQRGLQKDIRAYGDGNPGAFNVLRAGGIFWGGLAIMLEISKAAVPVGLAAQVFDVSGVALVLIAIAPVFGHAFSPFLKFKGGKAIAATFGTWIGLTLWKVPVLMMIVLVVSYLVLTSSGWAVMFTMLAALVYLFVISASAELFAAWLIIMLLLIYKHRAELTQMPQFKPLLFIRTSTPTKLI